LARGRLLRSSVLGTTDLTLIQDKNHAFD